MSDLKACPFCGRIPDIEDCGEHRWFIRCKCGIAQDKLFFQKCDAVRAWNKRKELRVKDTNVPITDTISRRAAIDAFKKELTVGESKGNYVTICSAVGYEGAKQILERLPSAEPVRMKGKWNKIHWKAYRCSECERVSEYQSNFCPNCGADMRGEEDADS